MQAAPDRGGLLLFGLRFGLWLLTQVKLAHDPIKRIVGLVRTNLAGHLFEYVYLGFLISHLISFPQAHKFMACGYCAVRVSCV